MEYAFELDDFDQLYEAAKKYKLLFIDERNDDTHNCFNQIACTFKNVEHEKVIKFLNNPNVLFKYKYLLDAIMYEDEKDEYKWLAEYIMQLYINDKMPKSEKLFDLMPFFMNKVDWDLPQDVKDKMDDYPNLTPLSREFIIKTFNNDHAFEGNAFRFMLDKSTDVDHKVLYSIMKCLDNKLLESLSQESKNSDFIKTFVHDMIIDKAIVLRGQFPSLVLANIISQSFDTSMFSENQVIGFIRHINEGRKQTLKERTVLFIEENKLVINTPLEMAILEQTILKHDNTDELRLKIKEAQNKDDYFWVDVSEPEYRVIRQIPQTIEKYKWFDNGLVILKSKLKDRLANHQLNWES